MTSWKDRLEARFAQFSLLIMSNPKSFLFVFVLLLIALGQNLRNVEFDSEMENFVDEHAEVRQIYTRVKDEFGRNDVIMLALQGDVLTTEFLSDLEALHGRIETEIPYVEEVTSLVNAPYQKGTEDSLEVQDLLGDVPQTEEGFVALEQRIRESTIASSVLVNDARTMALIMVELSVYNYGDASEVDPFTDTFDDAFDDDAFSDDAFNEFDENEFDTSVNDLPLVTMFDTIDMMEEMTVLLEDFPGLNPITAGMPAMNISLVDTMQSEMLFFIRLTIGLIILTLVAFFRQLNAVVAPMLTVLAALLLTMSTLVVTGHKIQVPLILLPTFLLAITIGDAVHLLTHFYKKIQHGEARIDAMKHAVERTSIPMLLTSLTTAGGLLSLSIADVIPIRNLGVFAALGVMLAFALTITLIPALVMLLPMRSAKKDSSHSLLARWIDKLGEISWNHGAKFALFWLVAVVLAFTQIPKLEFSHNPINWMPESLDIVKATQIIDKQLSGTMTTDIVFELAETNGVKQLEFLTALDEWQTELDGYVNGKVEVKGTTSIVDLIKESNRALQGGKDEFYALPMQQSLVNEEIFLFENSAADSLYQMVDQDFTTTKLTLVLPWNDMMHYENFVLDLQTEGDERFAGIAEVQVTGLVALLAGTMVKLVTSMVASYGLAACVISLMMMLLLNSVRLGLLAMLPNIAPIAVVMGLMYPFGIELDMLTILVATVAIGIAVDNTVHFTHHFRHGLEQGHDVHTAMQDAFSGAGQALFTTSIVLTAGFYVFLFSDVHSIFNLGFLCGTAFIFAMISNFTLTPFLLRWYFRNHEAKAVTE